jgi:hypothetical protein
MYPEILIPMIASPIELYLVTSTVVRIRIEDVV